MTTPGRPLTILVHEWVTGGGLADSPLPASWAIEGGAMRRALAADFAALPGHGSHVVVTLDSRLPDDRGPWTVEAVTPGSSSNRVQELASQADFTVLVAPETTGILSRLTRELEQAGARVLGSSPDAIDLTGDKRRLGEWLDDCGIDMPRTTTVVPNEGLPADWDYPAVLKPVDGAGSVDTFYLRDARSLPATADRLPFALLQSYVPGIPMSASFLVDGRGRPWLVGTGLQHVAIRDGRFEYRGGTLPSSFRADEPRLRRALESVPGLRGFVGIDFIWDREHGRATILEINPRPTTSCVGLTRLLPPGNLADAWIRAFDREEHDELLGSLADRVHSRDPLSFDASGVIFLDRGAVE